MAASVVTRSSWTDDSGAGIDGTIVKNSVLQTIYDNVDLMFSGGGSYTTLTLGGKLRIEGAGLQVKGAAAPAVSAAGECTAYFDSTSKLLRASEDAGAYFTALPWRQQAASDAEATVAAAAYSTLKNITGLSIGVTESMMLVFTVRSSASTTSAKLKIGVNGSDYVVLWASGMFSASAAAASGLVIVFIGPRSANYNRTVYAFGGTTDPSGNLNTNRIAEGASLGGGSAGSLSAAITDLQISAGSNGAGETVGVANVKVYQLKGA